MKPSASLQDNVLAVYALADILRTSLGPNARSKLIVTPKNSQDGAFIMRQLRVQHPAAVLLTDACLTLDTHLGDGTTSVCLLAAELIKNGFEQISQNKIPPSYITEGYRIALDYLCKDVLDNMVAQELPDIKSKEQVYTSVMAALSSKTTIFSDWLADLLTNAITRICGKEIRFEPASIQLVPVSGKSLKDSEIIDGVLVDGISITTTKNLKNCKVVVINESIQRKRTKTKITALLETTEQLKKWKIEEERVFMEQALSIQKITGANVILCSGKVHEIVAHHLDRLNILCIPYVDVKTLQLVCKVCNCRMAQRLEDLTSSHAGIAQSVEIVTIGNNSYTKITRDEKSELKMLTIVLRGSTIEQTEEYARHCNDALHTVSVLSKCPKLLPGGGATEFECITKLQKFANSMSSLEKVGVNCFSESLQVIPRTLAENAALDVNNTVNQLLYEHHKGNKFFGVPKSMDTSSSKESFDMKKQGVFDSLLTKKSIFKAATNIACTILMINDHIACKKQ